MDVHEIKFIFNDTPPFNKLDKRQLDKLINISEVREYKNGEIIYSEGGMADYLYVLLKGRVALSAKVDLKELRIGIIKRGTCFGIISIFAEGKHSVTTSSIESSFILRIRKEPFKGFLKKNPLISLDFSLMLSQRVQARFKPKTIFQSKKIGVIGNILESKTDYIYNLGREIKEQTQKKVICLQVVLPEDKDLGIKIQRFTDSKDKINVLSLKSFREGAVSKYIIENKVDLLYVKLDAKDNFLSLLNFLSESYHFILYRIPYDLLGGFLEDFVNPAQQLHFLMYPQKQELRKSAYVLQKLKGINPLNQGKIKVVLMEMPTHHRFYLDKSHKLIGHPIYASFSSCRCSDNPEVLTRISRDIGEVSLGLALGSGGAYGFSHIGVLKILKKEGVTIDIICGSSIGAVIAALWAAGFEISDVEKFAKEIGKKISSVQVRGLPLRGIINAKKVGNVFKRIFKNLTFDDLKCPLKIVAFDFLKRKAVILEEGLLYKALSASCALPGIFEPVFYKDAILLDGGILSPLPTKVLLNYGANRIIASNTSPSQDNLLREYERRGKFHIFDFIFGSIETMQQQFIKQALTVADVIIHPDLSGLSWIEFDRMSEFVKRGEEAAFKRIDIIKNL